MLTLQQVYEKNAHMDTIQYVHGVPQVVFIVWFGTSISDTRLQALNNLIEHLHVPYILITEKNYESYSKPEMPIHTVFPYLSGVHKSDYLRTYLLYHYGGMYHDIKFREQSVSTMWSKFSDPNIWIISRPEKHEGWIGYNVEDPKMKQLQKHYAELGTMGWVICRQKTPFLRELLNHIIQKLDKHHDRLILFPSENPVGYYSDRPFELLRPTDTYPIRWLELLGEKYHILMYKYRPHLNLDLPDVVYRDYK